MLNQIVGIICLIEAVTELLVNPHTITYKLITANLLKISSNSLWQEGLRCGECTSLRVSLIVNLYWLATPYWAGYPLFVATTWRGSNILHVCWKCLEKFKIFHWAKVG